MQQHVEQRAEDAAPELAAPRNAGRSKRELWLILGALTVLYVVMAGLDSGRFVWYDELFTLDIAKAPSVADTLRLVYRWEPNPPTSYVLSRFSMAMVGKNALGLRLPSMLEFYAASLLLFCFLRRRIGAAFAGLGLLLLWWSDVFRYATEARPYALMVMGFLSLLVCREFARDSRTRAVALWGVALSSLVLILSHVFAPLSLLPFLVAEGVRSLRTRKMDWAMWCALLSPMLAAVSYIPLILRRGPLLSAPITQASWQKIGRFFYDTLEPIAVVVILAGFAAALAVAVLAPRKTTGNHTELGRTYPWVEFAVLLLNPIALNLLLMHGHRAFWDRYSITTQVAIYMVLAILLARAFKYDPRAAYAGWAVILVFLASYKIAPLLLRRAPANVVNLKMVRPELPIVLDSEVTFFEMNHYESPELLSRLNYLKDRPCAIRYAHSTEAEDYLAPDQLGVTFAIRANVRQYNDFIHTHPDFIVFSTHDNPEGWLLQKLQADHARVSNLGEFQSPGSYRPSTLYLVSVPHGPGKFVEPSAC